MKLPVAYVAAIVLAGILLSHSRVQSVAGASTSAYLPDGRMLYPTPYREWIFLTSGLDMNYDEAAAEPGHSMFDNVFVNPEAYRVFLSTGTWPDHTVLVKEMRDGAGKGSINKHGKFQMNEPTAVEVHVKDTERFADGWGFFDFSGTEPARLIPATASCYSCHRQHAAVDSTFVQFYPTLLPVAIRKGTLAAGYHPGLPR